MEKEDNSGNTAPVHVVHVQRFIMIAEKNMDAEVRTVQLGANVTDIWKSGTTYSQFDNDGNGNYEELEQKNIDTGMGLERLALLYRM